MSSIASVASAQPTPITPPTPPASAKADAAQAPATSPVASAQSAPTNFVAQTKANGDGTVGPHHKHRQHSASGQPTSINIHA